MTKFETLRSLASGDLEEFLDWMTFPYMIDNIVLLITGTLKGRKTHELLDQLHPLGMFPTMEAITALGSAQEIYDLILIDTPIGPIFKKCLVSEDFTEKSVEELRNTLYKVWFEEFYKFIKKLKPTCENLEPLLFYEADVRVITVTANGLFTTMMQVDRTKFFPKIGNLFPIFHDRLKRCEHLDGIKTCLEDNRLFKDLLNPLTLEQDISGLDSVLQNKLMEKCVNCLQQHSHFGTFYAWFRLAEMEIRNIEWIGECIRFKSRERISEYIPTIRCS
eukprot:TRINITY_DN2154_c0_g1_i3.p1 TRINITY_DN2154_c0_g1~~TRINITY_DN2154_c0_g1_i3.p1  ORF type:complete len:276 (+),score=73.96 TRINITY_DN2154_c0_g1_i3:536-1363(+)